MGNGYCAPVSKESLNNRKSSISIPEKSEAVKITEKISLKPKEKKLSVTKKAVNLKSDNLINSFILNYNEISIDEFKSEIRMAINIIYYIRNFEKTLRNSSIIYCFIFVSCVYITTVVFIVLIVFIYTKFLSMDNEQLEGIANHQQILTQKLHEIACKFMKNEQSRKQQQKVIQRNDSILELDEHQTTCGENDVRIQQNVRLRSENIAQRIQQTSQDEQNFMLGSDNISVQYQQIQIRQIQNQDDAQIRNDDAQQNQQFQIEQNQNDFRNQQDVQQNNIERDRAPVQVKSKLENALTKFIGSFVNGTQDNRCLEMECQEGFSKGMELQQICKGIFFYIF